MSESQGMQAQKNLPGVRAGDALPGRDPFRTERYRYRVEVRRKRNGRVRSVHVQPAGMAGLGSDSPAARDGRRYLKCTDGARVFEADSLAHLAELLRARYPDAKFERTFRFERDETAELLYRASMSAHLDMITRHFLHDLAVRELTDTLELPTDAKPRRAKKARALIEKAIVPGAER